MELKNYETVFILTPVLSEQQTKDAVEKFKKVLTDNAAEIVHEDAWGMRKLAYPIQNKHTGYYQIFEFKAEPSVIAKLELEYKRDEKVIRFLTTALDKHAVLYNEKKRKGLVGKKQETKEA
ncbi:SSU ribosomal protein S6P [Pseudarcicella hirudinis]|uniref:Small ribosomal subunit protein bS6 n=1 Tax=Pseudarcicella hirudinis TaxID=1079859 RepID=A0A1I5X0X9_9BACT|nr:30S ribosomal protein S6 [Pseudarcicella hirudinis]SFQ25486.1 SSU ribosomal protein S6P [Pseudarcicella hirudinis]